MIRAQTSKRSDPDTGVHNRPTPSTSPFLPPFHPHKNITIVYKTTPHPQKRLPPSISESFVTDHGRNAVLDEPKSALEERDGI
jgi:hypothetical protein